MKKLSYIFILIFIFACYIPHFTQAQGSKDPVFVSGFVVDAKTTDFVPGVHLYIPKAGRGTSTSSEGFFALPTIPGDSVIVSCIGYKTYFYRVPKEKTESYSVVIELIEDTTSLAVIEVFPYPTEELFKEAFLALELPDEEKIEALRQHLDQQAMTRLSFQLPMDGTLNYRYQMYRDVYALENSTSIPTLQLLNPFAWARLFQSIKRGDFKKGKWKE
ncbi:MAG: carboxypeptidase-like regulatory domain-containing protein [Microscillaceae bacterium]|nr:carboxypeptidase-like regulatory domain-containing protein [Microscillaceae bacterium]